MLAPFSAPLETRNHVVQVSDVGALLTDAGFKLVTVDTDIVHVNFRDAVHAMETLQVRRLSGCKSMSIVLQKEHDELEFETLVCRESSERINWQILGLA